MTTIKNSSIRKLNGFDYFIMAGGLVNLAVVLLLVGYRLFN